MPHIHVLLAQSDENLKTIVVQCKTAIRRMVAARLGYPPEDIAVIPRLFSAEEMELSDNMLPLELVVDTGTRPAEIGDQTADELRDDILWECIWLRSVNFGIWIKGNKDNGFSEHKPDAEPRCNL